MLTEAEVSNELIGRSDAAIKKNLDPLLPTFVNKTRF